MHLWSNDGVGPKSLIATRGSGSGFESTERRFVNPDGNGGGKKTDAKYTLPFASGCLHLGKGLAEGGTAATPNAGELKAKRPRKKLIFNRKSLKLFSTRAVQLPNPLSPLPSNKQQV
ncbi:hypothetical protein E2C01_000031 [Portunus trituberculatus]|uniref:Uncharacterized protein n=1 Tax=Portunus trituberculatus TaxID=210409 RepID=A0A5B7CD41_PORTR|nr:hypothetical protein [Portunus trituberculatus]